MTFSEKKKRVDFVVHVLGLDHIKDTVVGDRGGSGESAGASTTSGISGGERKRVSIGMELVADPSILILDEPTTGLDATSAMEVMEALHHVADTGVAVVAVLHQPRFTFYISTSQPIVLTLLIDTKFSSCATIYC